MLKKKRVSENNLINSYYNCVLFKKYHQSNLCFGYFSEYENIKYCKKYIHKYLYYWVHIFLLRRFSLSFVMFLYKSPCFIKFVESGFFKYLDYHFLLLFSNNCFSFDLEGKQRIKIFVKSYFHKFVKKRIEKDLLILVIKVINEIILNVSKKYLIDRLKYIQIYVERVWLNDKGSFKLVTINRKKEIYLRGLFFFNYLIKKSYYKLSFSCLNSLYKLEFFYKLLFKSISVTKNKNLRVILKSTKLSKFKKEKILYYSNNKDVQYLVESIETLSGFNGQEKSIGLYKNASILFEDSFNKRYLPLKKTKVKTFKKLFKSFNLCFFRYKYKFFFDSNFVLNKNLKNFNKVLKKI